MNDADTEIAADKPLAVARARRAVMPDTPSWKWVLNVFGGIVVIIILPTVLWAGAMKSDVASAVDQLKVLAASQAEIARSAQAQADTAAKALAMQGERIAVVESWRSATNDRLGRIEAGQDRMEIKLDRALEKK